METELMNAISSNSETPVMPIFAFLRRRDIELEGGYILAGNLVIGDLPKQAKQNKKNKRRVAALVQKLSDLARAGHDLGDMMFGWPDEADPSDRIDTNDDAVMSAWARKVLIVAVRIDPRAASAGMRVDSDILRQLGLGTTH
jgi:hypothetical protein